jgi:hypothetical protein
MLRTVGIGLAFAGLPTTLASGASEPTPRFSVVPSGWSVPRPAWGAQDGYALSWRYRPNPRGWANSMPRNGIAVYVIVPDRTRVRYPPLRLRLPKWPSGTLEGAPHTPEYRIFGRVRGHDVEIRVAIRRPRPTAAQLRVAQRVVSGIRFTRP